MLTSYKDQLRGVMDRHRLDYRDFDGEEFSDGRTFVLWLRGSALRFIVWSAPDDFHSFACQFSRFAPGFPLTGRHPPKRPIVGADFGRFEVVLAQFHKWLEVSVIPYLKEYQFEDPWRIGIAESFEGGTGGGNENSRFSHAEQRRVRDDLLEFRANLLRLGLFSNPQMQAIDARLAYLEKATRRLGRKDWYLIAASVIPTLVASLMLDPQSARDLLLAVGQALSWVILNPPILP